MQVRGLYIDFDVIHGVAGIEPVFLLLEQDLLRRAEQGGMILRLKLGGDGRGLGGAALSLMEGALLIFLIVFLAPRLGVTWFADHAAGTHLLAWFLNNTPRSIIASLT